MNPVPFRKLPPIAAFRHALWLVTSHRAVGIRISLVWTLILLALAIASIINRPEASPGSTPNQMNLLDFASASVGLVAFCSIAVNWNRFVLRGEPAAPPYGLRIDGDVWRYAGNSLLVALAVAIPMIAIVAVTEFLPPIASALVLPAAIGCGTLSMALSLKLPAVALGRKDFGFRQAFALADGNFWPLLWLFLLCAAIALVGFAALLLVPALAGQIHPMAETAAGLALAAVFNIFYTLLSISVITSLYGFLVEKRDF